MPLGRPSITTPNALQLQALQQTVANIRERFRVTDDAISQLVGAAGGSLTTQQNTSRALQFQIDQLRNRLDVLERVSASADFSAVFIAAETIDIGAPVWVSSPIGEISNIDPDAVLASSGFMGVAATAGVIGNEITVRLPGGVVEIPGSTFTVGRPLYAQLGGVTQTPAGNSLPVGVAISVTEMSVGYGFNVLGDDTFDPTGQADMAVTYGLGGSGSGGILPVVTGEVPPVLVYLPDGNLVYTEVP